MSGWLGTPKQTTTSESQLGNVFNFALPLAQKLSGTGTGTTSAGLGVTGRGLAGLSSPAAFFQQLLSGNRAATNQAMSPQATQIRQQADAEKRQLATMGTARGGGATAANRQVNDSVAGKLQDL